MTRSQPILFAIVLTGGGSLLYSPSGWSAASSIYHAARQNQKTGRSRGAKEGVGKKNPEKTKSTGDPPARPGSSTKAVEPAKPAPVAPPAAGDGSGTKSHRLVARLITIGEFEQKAPWKLWAYPADGVVALRMEWTNFQCVPDGKEGKAVPVTCISAKRASDYCEEHGGALPTVEEAHQAPISAPFREWVTLGESEYGVLEHTTDDARPEPEDAGVRSKTLGFRCVLRGAEERRAPSQDPSPLGGPR